MDARIVGNPNYSNDLMTASVFAYALSKIMTLRAQYMTKEEGEDAKADMNENIKEINAIKEDERHDKNLINKLNDTRREKTKEIKTQLYQLKNDFEKRNDKETMKKIKMLEKNLIKVREFYTSFTPFNLTITPEPQTLDGMDWLNFIKNNGNTLPENIKSFCKVSWNNMDDIRERTVGEYLSKQAKIFSIISKEDKKNKNKNKNKNNQVKKQQVEEDTDGYSSSSESSSSDSSDESD